MARSEYYVDPLNGSDTTGDGLSDGTAWQTVQKALNSITKNTTDGDRINVKDTADDVLSAQLDFSTIGNYDLAYGLLIQGYTSTAGDGGIGGISGGGTTGIIVTQRNYIAFKDMHLHNTGANIIVNVRRGAIDNCEFNNSSRTGDNVFCSEGTFTNCYVHDMGGTAVSISGGTARGNYIKSGPTHSMGYAVSIANFADVAFNIISLDDGANGIELPGNPGIIHNNSILSDGTGTYGIYGAANNYASSMFENLIEGFSTGIFKTSRDYTYVASNVAYNCTTAFDLNGCFAIGYDNTEPVGSPFSKSGSDTFANRFTYFEPVSANAGTNSSGNGSRGAVANPSGGGTTYSLHPLAYN